MTPRTHFELPSDIKKLLSKVKTLEWLTLFFLTTITVVMYLVMGSSQAMKAAWVEDILSLIPPIAILLGHRFESKRPNKDFPFGYHNSVTVSFVCTATALLGFGIYLFYDSAMTLIRAEHPTIGSTFVFGQQIWMGWFMIAALTYSAIPSFILGRMKLKPARKLHDRALFADANMNKADWMTALAGIIGVVGIGLGYWWADAVAAGFIALDITKDGFVHMKRCYHQLLNHRPTQMDSDKPSEVETRLNELLKEVNWIKSASVRLREEGMTITGEVLFAPWGDQENLVEKLESLREQSHQIDWRIYDLQFVPVTEKSISINRE